MAISASEAKRVVPFIEKVWATRDLEKGLKALKEAQQRFFFLEA